MAAIRRCRMCYLGVEESSAGRRFPTLTLLGPRCGYVKVSRGAGAPLADEIRSSHESICGSSTQATNSFPIVPAKEP